MSLDYVRDVYEEWARENPFYAVLSTETFRDAEEDPTEFFENGRVEVGRVLAYVEELGLDERPRRERALDFGCGVGRLSQALAGHFERVDGVDVARPMVEKAREVNPCPDRVRFHVNAADDLALFDDASFDFVYSSLTLQHVRPRHIEGYVREFVRLLRPRGLAVFQIPDGPRIEPGSLRAVLYRLKHVHFRHLWKRLWRLPEYEMHHLARSRVEEVVEGAGGRTIDVHRQGPDDAGGGLRYCVGTGPEA